jgi:hypothetical protein
MEQRTLRIVVAGALAIVLAAVGLGVSSTPRSGQETAVGAQPPLQNPKDIPILSYAAKFVCLEPLQAGQLMIGPEAPILSQQTEVLIHNPQAFSVTFYKKAVRAPLESVHNSGVVFPPGEWHAENLKPDHALRVDCDEIAKLLTDDPTATFIGTYGIGVKVEGFVVVGVGPRSVAGAAKTAPELDVTAEYHQGSEVLKKDITYQPWWRWWWWPLPWRLGYAYQRIIPIDGPGVNIDCRSALYAELTADAQREVTDRTQAELTRAALERGRQIDPTTLHDTGDLGGAHALVAMIGRCDKIGLDHMSVDYVILSTDAPTDHNPLPGTDATVQQVLVPYPWIPGRWHDLTLVIPQNRTVDLDALIRDWQTDEWVRTNPDADVAVIHNAMRYFFPWWCGWGYWWWWWNGSDCIDIGVGEGEGIDVERITPVHVDMPVWPPV